MDESHSSKQMTLQKHTKKRKRNDGTTSTTAVNIAEPKLFHADKDGDNDDDPSATCTSRASTTTIASGRTHNKKSRAASTPAPTRKKQAGPSKTDHLVVQLDDPPLIRCLRLVDPMLQFLTKATGQTTVPLKTLLATLPGGGRSGSGNGSGVTTTRTTASTSTNEASSASNPEMEKGTTAETVAEKQSSEYTATTRLLLSNIYELAQRQILELVVLENATTMTTTSSSNFDDHNHFNDTIHQTRNNNNGDDNDKMVDPTWLNRARVGFPSPPEAISPSSAATTAINTNHTRNRDQQDHNANIQTQKVKAISSSGGLRGLHGSTKTAAKRRLVALRRMLRDEEKAKTIKTSTSMTTTTTTQSPQGLPLSTTTKRKAMRMVSPDVVVHKNDSMEDNNHITPSSEDRHRSQTKGWNGGIPLSDQTTKDDDNNGNSDDDNEDDDGLDNDPIAHSTKEEKEARVALQQMFQFLESDHPNTRKQLLSNTTPITGTAMSDSTTTSTMVPQSVLPKQVSYAGSYSAQGSRFGHLSKASREVIPDFLLEAFHLDTQTPSSSSLSTTSRPTPTPTPRRQLYIHQVEAVESALQKIPTLVCTGTGSGKSLCFLLPVLAAAYNQGKTSLILFPTKALAQDQVGKLNAILSELNDTLRCRQKTKDTNWSGSQSHNCPTNNSPHHHHHYHEVMAATLDGDCSHAQRAHVIQHAHVILTNPDTLHAAILPQHQKLYRPLLERVEYVVIDEAHMYEGVFGAHVALVLSRLARVCAISRCSSSSSGRSGGTTSRVDRPTTAVVQGPRRNEDQIPGMTDGPTFLACSATMTHPEHHFRLLCPLPKGCKVTIVKQDGSPRSSKHYFVWNPPLLDIEGNTTGRVQFRKRRPTKKQQQEHLSKQQSRNDTSKGGETDAPTIGNGIRNTSRAHNDGSSVTVQSGIPRQEKIRRRHSADETALLLARAVTCGIRCIAFCKTRCLVEWVYERAIAALQRDPQTAHLTSQVQSYRGGYTRKERRQIEEQLFQNKLLGVVGTSALELGVDIGGLDLTLHCGFPTSHASLLQQAGRAGRGKQRLDVPSLAIVVCFNSPPDQHLWRHPSSLLHPSSSIPMSMPIYPGLIQEHLLCAGQEFPLTGTWRVTDIIQTSGVEQEGATQYQPPILCDADLFGSRDMYQDAMEALWCRGSLMEETVAMRTQQVKVYKTHPSISKPHMRVSLRSIETVNYNIVNADHPGQGGRMDGSIYDEEAIMDIIPYSRVFYHAFPGAIITHRGRRYKIASMTRPPAFANAVMGSFRGSSSSMTLAAFAKLTTHRYYTRPLSSLHITVVKQMERVDTTIKLDKKELPTDTELRELPIANEVALPSPFDDDTTDIHDPSLGSFAGCGVVTIKRNVHGYKKISMVTREELSRSELSLPDMEFDSFAIWLDCDAEILKPFLGPINFGNGVHALSHALVAVAPLFVPCVMSDIQCDHAVYKPTRVVLFDERAGGSGICSHLWKSVFIPNGLVEGAIQLLEGCPSCSGDTGYQGGCPACLQFGECIKFNDYLCKSSGLIIAKHLLRRLKQTDLYQAAVTEQEKEKQRAASAEPRNASEHPVDFDNDGCDLSSSSACRCALGSPLATQKVKEDKTAPPSAPPTPRRSARARALQYAKDMPRARDRQVVVGRPSWPFDESSGHSAGGKLPQENA